MSKLQWFITRINFLLISVILFLYSIISFVRVFLRNFSKGDENSFLPIFQLFIDKGFYAANVKGNSILFNCVSFIFYKISNNPLLSLRLTSLFFGFLTVIALFFFIKRFFPFIPSKYRLVAYITSLNVIIVMSIVFSGINDVLLSFFTILFFYLFYKIKEDNTILQYYFLIGIIFSLMILTRLMSVIIIFLMLIVLLLLLFNQKTKFIDIIKRISIIAFTSIIIVISFNYPSLKENKTLSFHDKSIKEEGVNWSQLQYLSEIGYEKGQIKYAHHYSIKEVKEYLKENGENSLPKTLIESLLFDVSRTIKVFFREILYLIKPFSRLLGIVFILNIFLFIYNLFKRKIRLNYIILFSVLYIGCIAVIVSSYIEPRWFLNILILLPILFLEKLYSFGKENKLEKNYDFIIINSQLLILLIMNLPYIYKNFNLLY